jgi:hypothetical protein
MTTLSALYPTLLDLAKRTDPDGNIAMIAEIINEVNPILDDMVWKEGNLPTGHRATIRTGLPDVTFRKFYGYVQPSKSTTVQVTDNCAMLEAYATVDKALADLNGNTAAFRTSEDRAFLEAMSQKLASYIIYGNETTEPEAFTGLAPRFNSQSAENGCNIITSAATPDNTDNCSLWLICWGDNVHGIFPKGSGSGLKMEDKGQITLQSTSGYMEAYQTHYRWDCGLHVKDWRYVVRIQIDEEDLTKAASTGPDLIDLMSQAIDMIPNINAGRPVFYANRNVRSYLRRQIMNKVASSTLSIEQITRANGALIREPMFDGIPVRRCDALLSNETGI